MAKPSSDQFYNHFMYFYPMVDFFLKPQKAKFFAIINSCPPGQLLEIGIGDGSNLKYYKTHAITGVDTSSTMLEQARKRANEKVQLFQMSGENLSFAESTFDYVILSHVIAVINDPNRLLQEVDRVLKPNGKIFILNHFTPNNWLKYMDKSFQYFSKLFYFKSVFHVSSLRKVGTLKLVTEINAGPFSYFKILIYEKKH